MTSTVCPTIVDLRRSIEIHILNLYEADRTTLRPSNTWPGTYRLPDGTSIPAVYVVGPSMVPSNWTITGIETTIDAVPEIAPSYTMSGVVSFERWNVRFTNYGNNKGTSMPTTLLDIRRRLARTFPRDPANYMPRTEATFEALTAQILGAVLNPPIP